MRYLLDTNTCSLLVNNQSELARQKWEAVSVADVGVSSVTVSKLEYELTKSTTFRRNRIALDQSLLRLEILRFDELAGQHDKVLRAGFERVETHIEPMDIKIAAHALSRNIRISSERKRDSDFGFFYCRRLFKIPP